MAKCVTAYVAWLNRQGFRPVTRLMAYLYFVADAKGRAFPTFDTLVKKLGLRDMSYSEIERLLMLEGVVITKGKNTFGREQDMFQLPDAPAARSSGSEELRDGGVDDSRDGGSAEQRSSGTAEDAHEEPPKSSGVSTADKPPGQAPERAVQQEAPCSGVLPGSPSCSDGDLDVELGLKPRRRTTPEEEQAAQAARRARARESIRKEIAAALADSK